MLCASHQSRGRSTAAGHREVTRMANRFKKTSLRLAYDEMMAQAHDTSSMLYINGKRRIVGNYGASHRQAFWNGYDSVPGQRLPPSCGCKTSIGFACYRAGQDYRREK